MAKDELLTGVDVGSSAIRVVVGQRLANEDRIHVLGAAEQPAEGISKGAVSSIEDAVSSISAALEAVERMTGTPVERATVGLNGTHVTSQESHGVVAVAKADGEIREEDVERVIEAAQAVATPPNYEILHVVPRTFTVDNQRGIKDPVGMTGIRLEVDAQVILGLTGQVKNLTKCIYRTSVDIEDLVLSVLACAESVLTKRQRELGVALVNIGATTTSLAVFEEGDVLHVRVLPVGAGHVTNDIAIGLRTSIDLAERIKLEYGTALPGEVGKRDDINLAELGGDEGMVSRKHVAEIIEARMEEIFALVEKELHTIDRAGLLPAGIVLTGGGAKLPGLVELAKQNFRLPAAVGVPQDLWTAIDKVNDPTFTTALGLLSWAARSAGDKRGFRMPNLSSVSEVSGKLKRWVRGFLP